MNNLLFFTLLLLSLTCTPSNQGNEYWNSQSALLHNSINKKANAIEYQLNRLGRDSVFIIDKDSIQILRVAFDHWKDKFNVHCSLVRHKGSSEQTYQVSKNIDVCLTGIGKKMHQHIPVVKYFGKTDSLRNPYLYEKK